MTVRTHLRVLQEVGTNERPDLCAPCRGSCCRHVSGPTHPLQWGSTREEMLTNLTEAFKTGEWAIDWWEGNPTGEGTLDAAYFVRPAMKPQSDARFGTRRPPGLYHPSWGADGPCVFLDEETGCRRSAAERPVGCLAVVPVEGDCSASSLEWDKQGLSIAWIPFHDIIQEAADRSGRV